MSQVSMSECLYQNVYVAVHTVVCSFSLFEQQIVEEEKKKASHEMCCNEYKIIHNNK